MKDRLYEMLAFYVNGIVKNIPKGYTRYEVFIHDHIIEKIHLKNSEYYRCDVSEIWSRNGHNVLRRAERRSKTIAGLTSNYRSISKKLHRSTKY